MASGEDLAQTALAWTHLGHHWSPLLTRGMVTLFSPENAWPHLSQILRHTMKRWCIMMAALGAARPAQGKPDSHAGSRDTHRQPSERIWIGPECSRVPAFCSWGYPILGKQPDWPRPSRRYHDSGFIKAVHSVPATAVALLTVSLSLPVRITQRLYCSLSHPTRPNWIPLQNQLHQIDFLPK